MAANPRARAWARKSESGERTTPVGLLDRTGEFTAEVPTSATGHFRFFAGNGEWTLRTLAPRAEPVDTRVLAAVGSVAEVSVAI